MNRALWCSLWAAVNAAHKVAQKNNETTITALSIFVNSQLSRVAISALIPVLGVPLALENILNRMALKI